VNVEWEGSPDCPSFKKGSSIKPQHKRMVLFPSSKKRLFLAYQRGESPMVIQWKKVGQVRRRLGWNIYSIKDGEKIVKGPDLKGRGETLGKGKSGSLTPVAEEGETVTGEAQKGYFTQV